MSFLIPNYGLSYCFIDLWFLLERRSKFSTTSRLRTEIITCLEKNSSEKKRFENEAHIRNAHMLYLDEAISVPVGAAMNQLIAFRATIYLIFPWSLFGILNLLFESNI